MAFVGLLSVVAFVCSPSYEGYFLSNSESTQIPFELYHNRVYLPVTVNQREAIHMVLDTGAGMTGLSETTAQSLQLRSSGAAKLVGNGDHLLSVKFAKDVHLRVGDAELSEKSVLVVPFDQMEMHEGRPIQGILGVDLFKRFVVTIDYAAQRLTLSDPGSFDYHGSGVIIPLDFRGEAALFSAAILPAGGPQVPANLAVDLGTYTALRLYTPFLKRNRLVPSADRSVDSFDFGTGGEFPVRLGRVAALRLGSLTIANPATVFPEAKSGATASSAYDGTIGGAILSRFTVILDYPRREMILEPNEKFQEPFLADTTGLVLEAQQPDFKTIDVEHVLANSPAAAAGLRPHDVLLQINGRDAGALGLEAIRSLFCKPASYHVTLMRDTQQIQLELHAPKPLY